MSRAIVLDLDGTVVDFYHVRGWLKMLETENAAPYLIAKPIGNMDKLNGLISMLQGYGYAVEVVSWLPKGEISKEFAKAVRRNKRLWLKKHLPSVPLKNVHVVKYGTNKWRVSKCKGGILFDDERGNIDAWRKQTMSGNAVLVDTPKKLLEMLEQIAAQELA